MQCFGNCHYQLFNFKLTFERAEKYCQKLGGSLASVHSDEESDFIGTTMASPLERHPRWIGLMRTAPGVFAWADGTPVDYTRWMPGEPNNKHKRENCVAIGHKKRDAFDNYWNDANCRKRLKFVCKWCDHQRMCPTAPVVQVPAPQPDPHQCSCTPADGYQCFEDTGCQYRTIYDGEKTRSFAEAEAICQAEGGHLVSIHSDAELRYVKSLMPNRLGRVWFGAYRHQGTSLARGWQWTDGSSFDYESWLPGEPNNFKDRELCMASTNEPQSWNDGYCPQNRGYVCKRCGSAKKCATVPPAKVQIPVVTFSEIKATGLPCHLTGQQNYVRWNHTQCEYKFFDQTPKTFSEARRICKADGGDLLSITSPQEDAYFTHNCMMETSQRWIGLKLKDGEWGWTDPSVVGVPYINPNFRQNHGECAKHYKLGNKVVWRGTACSQKKSFVCKRC